MKLSWNYLIISFNKFKSISLYSYLNPLYRIISMYILARFSLDDYI